MKLQFMSSLLFLNFFSFLHAHFSLKKTPLFTQFPSRKYNDNSYPIFITPVFYIPCNNLFSCCMSFTFRLNKSENRHRYDFFSKTLLVLAFLLLFRDKSLLFFIKTNVIFPPEIVGVHTIFFVSVLETL